MKLLFDFDGTICDGLGAVIEILNQLFEEISCPSLSAKELRQNGFRKVFMDRNVNWWRLGFMVGRGKKLFSDKVPSLNSFPGLSEVLGRLAKRHELGIVTSNAQSSVEKFLDNHGLRRIFSEVKGDVEVFGKEKMIKKLRADYYVGDETRDIEAARKVGVAVVAVGWGFESPELLLQSKPDKLVYQPEELLEILK